jgi:hypothetical protein
MSSSGTPLLGRPTAGEMENGKQRKQRLQQTRLSEPTDFDMDLNFPWGDSIEEKPNNATRIFFQNVNGVSAANDFSAASEVGYSSDANQVDILCMAETNLDWGYKHTRQACNEHLRPFWTVINLSQRHPTAHLAPHTNLEG